MDYLWTPWRYRYLTSPPREEVCIFCKEAAAADDREFLVVWRGEKNYVILNRYPYTSGHVMIVPYAHHATLAACESASLAEMMRMAQRLQEALEALYHP